MSTGFGLAPNACIVMLSKNLNDHSDESTEQLIPDDLIIRINRNNIINELTEKIKDLIEHPEKIDNYSKRMRDFASNFLLSWDERIEYEIDLLKTIAKGARLSKDLSISSAVC